MRHISHARSIERGAWLALVLKVCLNQDTGSARECCELEAPADCVDVIRMCARLHPHLGHAERGLARNEDMGRRKRPLASMWMIPALRGLSLRLQEG